MTRKKWTARPGLIKTARVIEIQLTDSPVLTTMRAVLTIDEEVLYSKLVGRAAGNGSRLAKVMYGAIRLRLERMDQGEPG